MEMTIPPIPEEVLQRARVLGYLPSEYLDSVVELINQASARGLEATTRAFNEIVPKLDDMVAHCLFFRLWKEPNFEKGIKSAMFQSREVSAWIKRNADFLHAAITR